MNVRIAAAVTCAALALAACSAPDAQETPEATLTATETEQAEPAPTETAEPTLAEEIAAQWPDEDWAPAESPALTMTAEEREELVMELAGEDPSAFTDVDLLGAGTDDEQTALAFAALADIAGAIPRVGRDAILVSMLLDSGETLENGDAFTADDAAAMLEYGWGICTDVEGGMDYAEAFGTRFVEALGLTFSAAFETDESATAEAERAATAALLGAMLAHLQCPQYADVATDALATMGEE